MSMDLPINKNFFKITENKETPMNLDDLDLRKVKHNLLSDFKNEITVDSQDGQAVVQTPIEAGGENISVYISETQTGLVVADHDPSKSTPEASDLGADIARELGIKYDKGFYAEIPTISSYHTLSAYIWKVAQAKARLYS